MGRNSVLFHCELTSSQAIKKKKVWIIYGEQKENEIKKKNKHSLSSILIWLNWKTYDSWRAKAFPTFLYSTVCLLCHPDCVHKSTTKVSLQDSFFCKKYFPLRSRLRNNPLGSVLGIWWNLSLWHRKQTPDTWGQDTVSHEDISSICLISLHKSAELALGSKPKCHMQVTLCRV